MTSVEVTDPTFSSKYQAVKLQESKLPVEPAALRGADTEFAVTIENAENPQVTEVDHAAIPTRNSLRLYRVIPLHQPNILNVVEPTSSNSWSPFATTKLPSIAFPLRCFDRSNTASLQTPPSRSAKGSTFRRNNTRNAATSCKLYSHHGLDVRWVV